MAPQPDGPATYFDMIACDKGIALVLLLLTGSIEGAKAVVREYLATFDKYAFLWQKDLATEYAKFMATNPTLEVRSWLEAAFITASQLILRISSGCLLTGAALSLAVCSLILECCLEA